MPACPSSMTGPTSSSSGPPMSTGSSRSPIPLARSCGSSPVTATRPSISTTGTWPCGGAGSRRSGPSPPAARCGDAAPRRGDPVDGTETLPADLVVQGRPTRYRQAGSGRPVLLIHGAGGSGELWGPQLAGLGDVGRLLAVDLPGHGGTSGPGL